MPIQLCGLFSRKLLSRGKWNTELTLPWEHGSRTRAEQQEKARLRGATENVKRITNSKGLMNSGKLFTRLTERL
jgi:hypothetical protein